MVESCPILGARENYLELWPNCDDFPQRGLGSREGSNEVDAERRERRFLSVLLIGWVTKSPNAKACPCFARKSLAVQRA